jgi:hypothetical protein
VNHIELDKERRIPLIAASALDMGCFLMPAMKSGGASLRAAAKLQPDGARRRLHKLPMGR